MATQEYEFEMFDLRKTVLALVAEHAREDTLSEAKFDGKRLIRRYAESNASKAASAFATAFENAMEMVREDTKLEIEIEDASQRILADHDGEIAPSEIEGEVTELIRSIDKTNFTTEESEYPVVQHSSGFRVCTCPAQKYYIVCKHTLARVIERNRREVPAPR